MKIKVAQPREEYAGLGLQVSEFGNIYKKGKELKSWKDSSGNLIVIVSPGRNVFVHKLVYETFRQVREGDKRAYLIVHSDGNKANNHYSNLNLMTQSDHTLLVRGIPNGQLSDPVEQAARRAKVSSKRKTHCSRGHEFNLENTYYRKDGGRSCRPCGQERMRKMRAKRRGTAS